MLAFQAENVENMNILLCLTQEESACIHISPVSQAVVERKIELILLENESAFTLT